MSAEAGNEPPPLEPIRTSTDGNRETLRAGSERNETPASLVVTRLHRRRRRERTRHPRPCPVGEKRPTRTIRKPPQRTMSTCRSNPMNLSHDPIRQNATVGSTDSTRSDRDGSWREVPP